MEGRDKIVLAIAIFFFIVYLLSHPRYLDDYPVFISPGENSDYFFSKLYQNTGDLRIEVPLYNLLPQNITVAFTPRDSAQFQGYIVPKRFLGVVLTFGVMSVIHENSILLFMPIFGVFTAIVLYLIARDIFSKQVALIVYILTLLFPPFWILSTSPIKGDLPFLFSLLLGIFYIAKFLLDNQKKNLFLSCLFFFISIYFRLTATLLFIPIFLFLLYRLHKDVSYKNVSRNFYIKFLIIGSLIIMPILLLNNELYGDFLKAGYFISQDITESTIIPERNISILKLYNIYATNYLSAFPILLLALGIAGLTNYDTKRKRFITFYTIYAFIVLFLYSGSTTLWGTQGFYINSSFLRYMLPAFLLLNISLAFLISKLNRNMRLIIIMVLIVSYINIVFLSPAGIIDTYGNLQNNKEYRDFILNNIQPRSFVVTQYHDKILYPHTYIISSPYLSENILPADLGLLGLASYIPEQDIYNFKLLKVAETGANVYIAGNEPYLKKISLESLKEYLEINNYTLETIKKDSFVLYKITKLN